MKKITLLTASALLLFTAGCKRNDCKEKLEAAEANKNMVVYFYQELFGNKNIDIVDEYIAEDYIQHNPLVADGRQALKDALSVWFKDAQKENVDFQRVIAEDDLVVVHTRSVFGGKTVSVIDIFRIENGIIAEHWDVIQEVPDSAANPHPMF
jgi:predicted SnoaL-like aldol condensation-catalyzing enzyme